MLHPSQMFFKKMIISEGGVQIIVARLRDPTLQVREQVKKKKKFFFKIV
jgi:hypothetical protein